MSSLIIAGDTSGTVTLQAPAVSGATVLSLPSTSGSVAILGNAIAAKTAVASTSGTSIDFTGFGSPSSHKDSCCSLPPNFTTSPPMSPLPEMDMERDAMANSLDLTGNAISFFSLLTTNVL